ncbi:unnamed protein product [Scytosiphon promiscuus]
MSARLMQVLLLLAARTRPEQQVSAARADAARLQSPPAWTASRTSTPPPEAAAAAFVGWTPSRPLTRFEFSSRPERGVHVSSASVHRPPCRGGSRPRHRRRRRGLGARMDVDGPPEVSSADGKSGVAVQEEDRWRKQKKEPAAAAAALVVEGVELPNVQAPTDLPQPGEWLHMPPQQGLGPSASRSSGRAPYSGYTVRNGEKKSRAVAKATAGPGGRAKAGGTKAGVGAKADPFAVPDNDYADSFLDSLWINLLSSRMSAAVEAEARAGAAAKEQKSYSSGGGGTGPSVARAETGAAAASEQRSGSGGGGIAPTAVGQRAGAPPPPPPSAVGPGEASLTAKAPPGGGGGMGGGYTYDDYVALATRLQAGAPERQRQVVRGVLRSLFPVWFPAFYRTLFPRSKFSAEVNAFMCPPLFGWLVGKSELTEGAVDIEAMDGKGPTQEVWRNTVKVERCRYLEASKCKGTCMNLCKLPTEAFFREDLGMPLRMTPNFEDLSCEFAFGQDALPASEDPLMQEPCWTECLSSGKQPKKVQRACHTMPESPLRGP